MSLEDYRNKVRVRVCGLMVQNDSILLVKLRSPVSNQLVWMPPGGGLEFGESLEDCLQREFLEETGLQVQPEELIFVNELVEPPYHAVELYYKVTKTGGELALGKDPEQESSTPLLRDVKWMPFSSIPNIAVAPARLREYIAAQGPAGP